MGYSTSYSGSVKIVPEPTVKMINEIKEAIANNYWHKEMSWNLEVSKDMESIEWRWCEKTRDFEETLNALIFTMSQDWEDFDLVWEFTYQGEEQDDRGYVRKNSEGIFERVEKNMEADEYQCPDCGHIFTPKK